MTLSRIQAVPRTKPRRLFPSLISIKASDLTPVADGTVVTSITDSKSGVAFTVPSGSAGPKYYANGINGKPILRFTTASANALSATGPLVVGTPNMFAYMVVKETQNDCAAMAGGPSPVSGNAYQRSDSFEIGFHASDGYQPQIATGDSSNTMKLATVGPSNRTVYHLLTFQRTATGVTVSQDLTAGTTVTGTFSNLNIAYLVLGGQYAQPSQLYTTMDLAEVGIMPGVATAGQLSRFYQYIRDEYGLLGIAAPLPSAPTGPNLTSYPFSNSVALKQSIAAAPLAPNSAAVVAQLADQATWGSVNLNAYEYSTTMVTAAAGTPLVTLGFNNWQNKTWTDPEFGTINGDGSFTPGPILTNVPIPAGTVSPTGGDHALAIYSPTLDCVWEFWGATQDPTTGKWSAAWGGKIANVSTNTSGAFNFPFGRTATGIASTGTDISIKEAQAGVITHAVALQILQARTWPDWSYPANRTDGWNPNNITDIIREGQRLRLKSSYNVAASGLHPIAKMVALAAQTYGLIVTDTSTGGMAISAENASNYQNAYGVDPWAALLAGSASWQVFNGFPWSQLEAIQVDYGKP
jgi:hypothetical protein